MSHKLLTVPNFHLTDMILPSVFFIVCHFLQSSAKATSSAIFAFILWRHQCLKKKKKKNSHTDAAIIYWTKVGYMPQGVLNSVLPWQQVGFAITVMKTPYMILTLWIFRVSQMIKWKKINLPIWQAHRIANLTGMVFCTTLFHHYLGYPRIEALLKLPVRCKLKQERKRHLFHAFRCMSICY